MTKARYSCAVCACGPCHIECDGMNFLPPVKDGEGRCTWTYDSDAVWVKS